MASQQCLGIFLEAAIREARLIPYVRRKLGKFQANPNLQFSDGIYVNNKNRYAAYVNLELNGQKGYGTLMFRFRENEKKLLPLNLFAEQNRKPDYPLTFKSPRWESSDGEKVKLSAKTGEPL